MFKLIVRNFATAATAGRARPTIAAAVLWRWRLAIKATASVELAVGVAAAAVSVVERQRSASGDGFHRLTKIEFDPEVVRGKRSSSFPAN